MLEDDPGIEVVAEASDGEEAVRLAKTARPQVVVIDYAMPGLNGVAATRQILRDAPETKVIVLSMHSEETLVRQAVGAGARGYVLKSAIDLDLAAVVKRAAAGEAVLDPRLTADPLKGAIRRWLIIIPCSARHSTVSISRARLRAIMSTNARDRRWSASSAA